ncbi:capsule biosynthesis protein [Paracoccus aminovorans]|uniref:capsule biosynthesis protein n=1 Tax=Paracoccus aminovorans TaxID=34004 RepID=UPI002B258636|nr:capsule biosynthesis protein [Paracoccus aminovorans]
MTTPLNPAGAKAGPPAEPAAEQQPSARSAPDPAARPHAQADNQAQPAPAQPQPNRPFQAQPAPAGAPVQRPPQPAAQPAQRPAQPQTQQGSGQPNQPRPQAATGQPPRARPQGTGTQQPLAVRPQAQGQPIPVKPMGRAVAQPAGRQVPAVPPTPVQPVRPAVGLAQPRRRHWLMLASFLLLVVLPTLLWAWYLWARASDQYVSTVGFSVRKEQAAPSIDLLGGLSSFTGASGTASDTDILYEYIRSQDMVEKIDSDLDLRSRFSRDWPRDFVFAFNPEGHVEDLTEYWQRQVKVLYDSSTALITLNVSAFSAEDAQAIAAAVFKQSSDKINQLSAIAQEDATRLAKLELDKTRDELTTTRQAMTAFRMKSQIVDPQADLAGQMGVLSGLQAQLAEALVAHDMLLENAQPTDHRVTQSQQKIDALRRLIDQERSKFGAEGQGPAGESYAQLMAEYEKLAVDREFAEGAYRTARIAYETAMAEAQRQSRYLAAHIEPKVAQSSTEPRRLWLLFMVSGMLLAGWSILVLIYYSIRDRG